MGASFREGCKSEWLLRERSEQGSSTAPREGNVPAASSAPHVLTITPFYPREENESDGCFIAEPLAEMIRAGLRSTVFAVEPIYRPSPPAFPGTPQASWYRYPSLPGGVGLASAGIGLNWRLREPVAALHKRLRVDLIHAHGALPCGEAAALLSHRFKIPYIVSVHGLDAFSTMQVGGRAGEWCRRASQKVFHGARRVIGVSRRVCAEVEKGMDGKLRSPTSVVYNGVDPTLFQPGQEPSHPVLLTVGNLIPSKGHELIVRGLSALKPEFPQLTWEVIGDGPELDRIRGLAQGLGVLGSVRFLGRRSRRAVADACRRCTAFVLPSRSEGLGCVYLEAMASGKAAVGCLGQGIEEVIRHGENGWLIPPDSLPELTEGLKILLRDPCRRLQMGKAARQTILDGFTLQHQAQRLKAVYQECSG
jgi:teichuronic acid biosynthesis glycosyltransferase TuaC